MNYMTAKKSKRNVVKSKKTKFTSFLFAVVLTFSVILVAMSFKYATLFRIEQGISGNSIGGEVFYACPANNPNICKNDNRGETEQGRDTGIQASAEKGRNVNKKAFTITAYCPCEKCCGIYAKSRPKDENGVDIVLTASGEKAVEGVTIAADTNVLPFGTKVEIDGNVYTVQDRGGAIKGNRIDIYFESHEKALQYEKQTKEVIILKGE